MKTHPSGVLSAAPPASMEATLALAARYATLPEDILLVGPTGSGKGHLAEFLHRASGRIGAFVPVTGGQLSDTLWATQLFGHFAGAFTDAKARALGAFERAAGGTLFLDELHHWGAAVQGGLLQPLESRRYFPLGAQREIPATCRLVFATTMCPDQLVAGGRLLPDLRYRLPALILTIPPLAARQGEILTLLDLFTVRTITAFKWEIDRFRWSASAVRALLLYPWPGNIRELLHVVKRTLARIGPAPERAIEHTDLELPPPPDADLTDLLAPEVMRRLVAWALARTDGARQEAADLLGVHRNTLTRYMARWGGSVPARHTRAPSVEREKPLDEPLALPESA
jgi:DNA-binding NtrC family response regulator